MVLIGLPRNPVFVIGGERDCESRTLTLKIIWVRVYRKLYHDSRYDYNIISKVSIHNDTLTFSWKSNHTQSAFPFYRNLLSRSISARIRIRAAYIIIYERLLAMVATYRSLNIWRVKIFVVSWLSVFCYPVHYPTFLWADCKNTV